MMFQRPPRGPKHNAPEYNPLAPQEPYVNNFVPPNLPTYPAPAMPAVPSAPFPKRAFGNFPMVNRKAAPAPAYTPRVGTPLIADTAQRTPAAKVPVPKKMNTETNAQYQARLQRLGANPAAPSVPSSGGLQKLNTESNAQFEARKLRHADGYTPPPSRDNLDPRSPSDAMQPRQRDYFGDAAIEGSLAQLEDNSRSGILRTAPLQPSFRDRTGTAPLLTPGLMPDAPTASPVAPGVNEELLSRLPSRSDRDRSSMQPGGMVSGDTFDAMAAREREERLAPQRALAQREDVTAEDNLGFTRTVDRDPNSPTFGQAKVVGDTMFGPSVPSQVETFLTGNVGSVLPGRDGVELPGNLNTKEGRMYRKLLNESREPRRKARLAGEVYTDPETGAVSDYGKFNEAREARQERKDAARELRTRAAQLQNYGRTGGVMVDPSGGIAGPMHVGNQATFGPNMSRMQAIRMAQGQVDREDLLQEAMKRADDKERMSGLKELAVSGDRQAAAAYRREFGIGKDDPLRTEIDDAIESGTIPAAPKMTMNFEATPVKDREQMAFQIDRIIDSPALSRNAKIKMLEEMYGVLTPEKIDALQNGTSYDKLGPRDYTLTKKFKEFFGLSPQQQAEKRQSQSGGTGNAFDGVMDQQQRLMDQFGAD